MLAHDDRRSPAVQAFQRLAVFLLAAGMAASGCTRERPVVYEAFVFEEVDGRVSVEAEHYHERSAGGTERAWYTLSVDSLPGAFYREPPAQVYTASQARYVEGLPDTRVTHDDSLIVGTNFYPEPGIGPTLGYRVWFNTPGRYLVWARAHSTGTEDNGIHVGLDGDWPESGQRIQWCDGKNQWTWSSAQRVPENHCGVPRSIYLDVESPGLHTIQFSMREDGLEFDKWIMTLHEDDTPVGAGPEERVRPLKELRE